MVFTDNTGVAKSSVSGSPPVIRRIRGRGSLKDPLSNEVSTARTSNSFIPLLILIVSSTKSSITSILEGSSYKLSGPCRYMSPLCRNRGAYGKTAISSFSGREIRVLQTIWSPIRMESRDKTELFTVCSGPCPCADNDPNDTVRNINATI